jgi:uncharacterized metal-binding protein
MIHKWWDSKNPMEQRDIINGIIRTGLLILVGLAIGYVYKKFF